MLDGIAERAKTGALRLRNVATAKVVGIIRRSPHLEHYGFAAYAACETFALHHVIYLVAIWLFVTGVFVEIFLHFFDGEL